MKPTRTQLAWQFWLDLPAPLRIVPFIVAVMLALWAMPARAETMLARNGNDSVRLQNKPCTNEAVLQQLAPNLRELMREATAIVGGAPYRACWIVDGDSAHLMYEDGDQGLIPLRDFKLDDGA